jgi:tRNA modification GTPase
MKIRDNDTIAAIATPIGEGAIGVIRISGPEVFSITDKVFRGKQPIADAEGYSVHYGKIVDANGGLLDKVLVTVFRNPHSYTGEDAVEISCHGGLLVTNKILGAVLRAGARQADPGEYTKRAFLNGKMDLSQAEAVADLIAARSERAHNASINQLEGKLTDKIGLIKSELIDLCSLLELELDFSEEGIPLVSEEKIKRRLTSCQNEIRLLMDSFEVGRVCREGVKVALVGKPNAGKSSLFNALLRENRAIVTPLAGTTRDFLEEYISLSGVLFSLTDTAGLTETESIVESEGVARSVHMMSKADVVVVIVDATLSVDKDEAMQLLHGVKGIHRVVIVYNKCDLLDEGNMKRATVTASGLIVTELFASAKTGEGLDVLKEKLAVAVVGDQIGEERSIRITLQRHFAALSRSRYSLSVAASSVLAQASSEFVALDVRGAINALSEITGEITTDDILDNIFGKFCIGK